MRCDEGWAIIRAWLLQTSSTWISRGGFGRTKGIGSDAYSVYASDVSFGPIGKVKTESASAVVILEEILDNLPASKIIELFCFN